MIKILIVDDSATETVLLKELFASAADIQVVGTAKNGDEAVKLAAILKPDLITMDLIMPIMSGLEAIRTIMSQNPIPIIVISSAISEDMLEPTFQALEAGALSVLEKPNFKNKSDYEKISTRIIETVRSMSEIKVIRRRFITPKHKIKQKSQSLEIKPRDYELIAIGSSVGGPQALKAILTKLPSHFSVPIVVVQHMTKGFIKGFASWLNQHTQLTVKDAEHNEVLEKGTVYFAPDQYHLMVKRSQDKLVAHLMQGEAVSGFCPSATILLHSVAQVCGKNAIGILLTGMGSDGAQGLLDIKNAQGHTIIQDPKSSVVFGMAGVAHAMGAVDQVVELEQIAEHLQRIVKR